MNVAGSAAGFFNSQIIQAIEWAVNVDKVDVLNESIGGNPIPDTNDDPVALADQAAVASGVTVVASSGDAGPTNTIGSPASGAGVITAGGSTAYRVYRQTTRYDTQVVPGGWESNNITALSSAGTTEFGPRTVDVVAPGDRGWTLCSSDIKHFTGCGDIDKGTNPPPIWAAGGTSVSAPLTSGTAALVIQAYESSHGGAKPSPDLVKRIIVSSATDLGAPADHQGAGLVNSLKAVQLALSIAGNGNNRPAAVQGAGLLASTPNPVSVVPAGTSKTFHVNVTNAGQVASGESRGGGCQPCPRLGRHRNGQPQRLVEDTRRRRGQRRPLQRAQLRRARSCRLPEWRHRMGRSRPTRTTPCDRAGDGIRPSGKRGGLLVARHQPQRAGTRRDTQAHGGQVDRRHLHDHALGHLYRCRPLLLLHATLRADGIGFTRHPQPRPGQTAGFDVTVASGPPGTWPSA